MNFSNKDFLRKFDGSADLVTFTQEIVHGKRHFLYIVNSTGVAHCVKKLDLDSKDCWFNPAQELGLTGKRKPVPRFPVVTSFHNEARYFRSIFISNPSLFSLAILEKK